MKIESEYPFLEYNCYKVFHKKMNRWQLCYVNKTDKKERRTITYAKYLMCIKMGRILTRQEEVDHIDNDKTNDDINNLQIITQAENTYKHHKTLTIKMVRMFCYCCNTTFEREHRRTFLCKKSQMYPTACSASCAKYLQDNYKTESSIKNLKDKALTTSIIFNKPHFEK